MANTSQENLSQKQLVQLSKSLSYVLRHGAEKLKLKIRSDGFILLDEVLALPQHRGYTAEHVMYVVDNNDKKRFELATFEGQLYIKARQGHTIQVTDLHLKKIDNLKDIPVVVHGTYMKSWESIKEKGLSKMERNHIHFAKAEYGSANVISGMRSTCNLYIYIDTEKAMNDGIEFFESDNGVILSSGVDGVLDPRYFKYVLKTPNLVPFDPDFPNAKS